MSGVLAEIIEWKKKSIELEEEIKRREEEAGIPALREELELINATIKESISVAASKGIMSEGSIQIVDKYREMRKIRTTDFQHAHPDVFWKCVEVKVTQAENAMVERYLEEGYDKKRAKELAKETITEFSDINVVHSYSIIDVVEGI